MILLSIFTVLQILDIYTTYTILSRGGIEQNPIMDKLFKLTGNTLVTLLISKLCVIYLVYLMVFDWPYLVVGFCILYTGIIIHNNKSMPKRE